eukprot:TRINITY_DN58523_c0_g1_i2.p2 TRINITY_DN58523_c0_g1~~TRINITY_DN58523_c0_g1_i2.p2  ORF type:complete len:107 (-),score=8.71 TRINITY_DN58523_c0_g1_i2:24-344(-)
MRLKTVIYTIPQPIQFHLSSEPVWPVTVDLSVSAGGAGDLWVVPSQLVFNSSTWMVGQRVTVSVVEDFFDEGVEHWNVTHVVSSADPVYASLSSFEVAKLVKKKKE